MTTPVAAPMSATELGKVWTRVLTGEASEKDLIEAAASLEYVHVRDALVLLLAKSTTESPDIEDEYAIEVAAHLPEGPCVEPLTLLARSVPTAATHALLACVLWGEDERRPAVDHCLAALDLDRDYRLAQLLWQLIGHNIHP